MVFLIIELMDIAMFRLYNRLPVYFELVDTGKWYRSRAEPFYLIRSENVFAGLKAGILCSGMMMVVFLEMFRAVFCARFFRIKLPKPRR